jgi:hypothetical protein
MSDQSPTGAGTSAYASGGGGVVLEHVYGATVLAALLIGTPFDLLGDAVLIDQVAFQARDCRSGTDAETNRDRCPPRPGHGAL